MIPLVHPGRDRVRLMNDHSRSSGKPAWSVLFLGILAIACFGQPIRAKLTEEAQDAVEQKPTEVEYQRLDIRPSRCSADKPYVVDDEKALQALLGDCNGHDIKLPKIDFSRQTLIAMFVETDLCQKLKLKIIRDDVAKRYRHIVTANKPLRCRAMVDRPFWVLIPKLPIGYEVTFESKIESADER